MCDYSKGTLARQIEWVRTQFVQREGLPFPEVLPEQTIRQRLPEALLAWLAQQTGRQANQAAYPQSSSQKPGVGFPLARIGVLFSLSVGTVVGLSVRRYAGKFQSELAMLHELLPTLEKGDILLSDRYLCSFTEIALLVQQGVDFVGRMHASRQVDFRRGRQLGKTDHVVEWTRPPRPEWMSPVQYA